ncbi:MAG: hypothetical protein P8J32_05260 [bacterium]|nr:hypothetical protein [bacterium]
MNERDFLPHIEGGDFCLHGNKIGGCARCAESDVGGEVFENTEATLEEVSEEHGFTVRREQVEWDENIDEILWVETPEQKEGEQVPTMRAYRGVGKADASILQKVGYAYRSRETRESKDARIFSGEVREAIEALNADPTHEMFLKYYEAVAPHLNDSEMERISRTLERLEDQVIEGMSFRILLAGETTHFNGGYMDTGAPPFLSATTDQEVAYGYSSGTFMVLDVPVSDIEPMYGAIREGGGELVIRGVIKPEQIKAVVTFSSEGQQYDNKENAKKSLHDVMHHIEETIGASDNVTAIEWLEQERDEFDEGMEVQREKDIISIRSRRLERLYRVFRVPDDIRETALSMVEQEDISTYEATKRAMYDQHRDRLNELVGEGRWDHWKYKDKNRKSLPLDREHVTEEMLQRMQDQIKRREEW